jgi:hypothetical protein
MGMQTSNSFKNTFNFIEAFLAQKGTIMQQLLIQYTLRLLNQEGKRTITRLG